MLNASDFAASTRYLTEQVDAFTTSSMEELLEYCQIFAVSRKPYYAALLLKPRFDKRPDGEAAAALKEEMKRVIKDIVSNRHNASDAELSRHEKRKDYIASQKNVDINRDVVCESKELGYRYPQGDFHLANVSLTLRLGEVTGIVGENANGKTTLFRLLIGERKHSEGSLSYPGLGSDDPKSIDWTSVKNQIAYVPQQLENWYGTIEQNLRYAAASKGITGQRNDWELSYISERLGLGDFLERRWSELSGGFKLRCALARALIWKPKFLALDEPLANLDFRSQLSLLRDIRDLANSYSDPIAVLLSSQHLHEVEAVADRILFLSNGKVVYYGPRDELGSERDENTFELGLRSETDLVSLRRQINVEGIKRIVFDGMSFVVTTTREFEQKEFLELLIKRDLPVRYFRDISTSVKRLFEQDELV